MDTKKAFRFFTLFEYEKEQEYLREMHRSGWKFVRVSGFGIYHFEKCTPEDMIYQIDYNQDGIAHKDEYVKMFGDCGWEYLQNYAGYSYFRKAASDIDKTEEIFCDDVSRLDMMKRVFAGRMIPLLVVFFSIIIPQIIMQSQVNTPINRGLLVFFCVMFLLYLALFISFAIPFWKYYKAIHKK